jgi:multidrug efflux pump subunit AcrB
VVEKTLTTPIDAKLRELSGVEHIYSTSQDSGAKVTVQFFVGQNWEDSLFKLQNHLYNYQDLLPPGARYLVKPVIIDDVPIVTLTVTGKNYSDNQLRRVGERLLEDLRSIPNTANLTITGGQPRAIRVDLDPDKLASYKILAEVYGPDYKTLRQLTKQVRQVFGDTEEVVNIDDSVKNQMPQMRMVVDREKVNRAGLTTQDIAQTLNMAIAGSQVSTLKVPGELSPVAIQVRFADANRQSIDDLTRIQLPAANGRLVPLTELVTFQPATVDQPILHKDQRPVSYVMGEMGDRSSVYAVLDQLIYFFRNPLPKGYWIQWDGEWKLTLDVFRDLGLAMLVAVLLIYLILVGQFRSFKVPLIILGSIPLALIGILLAFSVNGVYFSATAMIGVIALAGIVVRNAIVLLEFIGDKLKEGAGLRASILEAGAVRFRPILLTSVTTMLGTLSILNDPVWSGLAWALLGGMLTSSFLTLFVIPLMYYGDRVSHQRNQDFLEPPAMTQEALN